MSRDCKQQPHSRKAVTRLEVLAVVWVMGLLAWLLIPAYIEKRVAAHRQICLSNLSEIGKALSGYLATNGERWPYVSKLRTMTVGGQAGWPTLPDVLTPYLPADSAAYRCPSDERRLADDDAGRAEGISGETYYETEGLSYEWWWGEARGGRRIGEESISKASGFGYGRADQSVLADFEPFHTGDGRGAINTLFADFQARSSRGVAR